MGGLHTASHACLLANLLPVRPQRLRNFRQTFRRLLKYHGIRGGKQGPPRAGRLHTLLLTVYKYTHSLFNVTCQQSYLVLYMCRHVIQYLLITQLFYFLNWDNLRLAPLLMEYSRERSKQRRCSTHKCRMRWYGCIHYGDSVFVLYLLRQKRRRGVVQVTVVVRVKKTRHTKRKLYL